MSIVDINADISIAHIVEAMLPRFSDRNLGLYINLQIELSDFGYGADGNTREREPMSARSEIHMLFVRPSNYTQVYALVERWNDRKEMKYVLNGNNKYEWTRTSNHDSCWRSDGFRPLNNEYFHLASQFDGREKSGKKIPPCDYSKFNHINYDPEYVEVDIQPANPDADRCSREGFQFIIDLKQIPRYRLEQIGYKDKRVSSSGDWVGNITSGVLIKGSEYHQQALQTKERCDAKYGELV